MNEREARRKRRLASGAFDSMILHPGEDYQEKKAGPQVGWQGFTHFWHKSCKYNKWQEDEKNLTFSSLIDKLQQGLPLPQKRL